MVSNDDLNLASISANINAERQYEVKSSAPWIVALNHVVPSGKRWTIKNLYATSGSVLSDILVRLDIGGIGGQKVSITKEETSVYEKLYVPYTNIKIRAGDKVRVEFANIASSTTCNSYLLFEEETYTE